MKASLNWINQYVKIDDLTPAQIADKLTFAGIEVEGITTLASATNLVIGEILSCEKHPDSDHLHVLQVDEGPKYGIHQIVCGAPNARQGLKVIVAREGAKLPGGTIEKSEIRGVTSDGMCCALYELGVDKKSLSEKQIAGIEELPLEAKVGNEDVLNYLGLGDTILDLSILPNRPDMYAIMNVAREIGCLFAREVKLPEPKKLALSSSDFEVGSLSNKCPQFAIREVQGVKVGPSPRWLQEILRSEGIRSINNIVDIGNYVMLLTGEPLNMYDLDKLPKKSLIVRDDLEGNFLAMDQKSYRLEKGDLVVTSEGKPMCLAGIMTASACMVDEATTNVAVESAVFDYARIRHTSNRIGLASESSLRFAKGINTNQAEYVLSIASDLLKELAGAHEVMETSSYDTLKHAPVMIDTSLAYLNGRLGTSFSNEEILDVLKRDHLEVTSPKAGLYHVVVPSYRIDMDGEADLSEEVIRILGYDNVHSILPTSELTLTGLNEKQNNRIAIRRYLRNAGLDEFLTYTLVNADLDSRFAYLEKGPSYRLKNPMTNDHEFVRRSLLPSLLAAVAYNGDRQEKNLACFEVSDIDAPSNKTSHLGLVLAGEEPMQGSLKKKAYDFYDAKGLLEGIMAILNLGTNRYQIEPWSLGGNELHPGKSAEIRMGKKLLGYLGELHPNELKRLGLKNAVVMELDLGALLDLRTSPVKASIPPRFPSVSRDLAFVLDQKVSYAELEKALGHCDALIKGVHVFDVYEGENIAKGKKSVALTLTIQSEEKTLKDEEVAAVVAKAIALLKVQFGAEIRS
jgi:phenylalanyl-tRNA synthetase beta chain